MARISVTRGRSWCMTVVDGQLTSLTSGYSVKAMDFAGGFPSYSACQISSVMNGINGDSRRREASKTAMRVVNEDAALALSSSELKLRRSFTTSRYQSQKSPQKKR